MKHNLFLISLLFVSSGMASTAVPKDYCPVEFQKIKANLGPDGSQTKITAENYQKALETLKTSFTYPTAKEVTEFSEGIKMESSDFLVVFERANRTGCYGPMTDLIMSLQQLAEAQKNKNNKIAVDIWNGLNQHFQMPKFPMLIVLAIQVRQYEKTLKIYKPNDKGLLAKVSGLREDIKSVNKKFFDKFATVDFEKFEKLTPKHFEALKYEERESTRIRTEFFELIKSAKI